MRALPGCQWEVQHPPAPPWAEQSHGLATATAQSLVLQPVPGSTELPAPAPLPAVSPEGDAEAQGRQGTTATLCWLRGSAQPDPGGTEAAVHTSIYWLLVILDVAPGLNALMKYQIFL